MRDGARACGRADCSCATAIAVVGNNVGGPVSCYLHTSARIHAGSNRCACARIFKQLYNCSFTPGSLLVFMGVCVACV